MKERDGFELRRVAGQDVIIAKGVNNIDFNKIISMNSSSAYLWKALEGKEFSVENVADALVEKYAIDRAIAIEDAQNVIEQWSKAGILEV